MAEGMSVLDFEWHCPSCTYINKAGSFKCFMCGAPKGTATRQVKFHTSALEQQYAQESFQSIAKLHSSRVVASRSIQPSSSASNSGSGGGGGGEAGSVGLKKRLRGKGPAGPSSRSSWPKLGDVDRSNSKSFEVTVDSLTVIITEFFEHLPHNK